jgi:urocanate hydratase
VTPATLVSIAVTPATPSIAKGTTKQFVATGTYSDDSKQDVTAAATWASATMATATVSNAAGSAGLANGLAMGTSVISATIGTVSGNTTLTVTVATLVSISVTPPTPSIAPTTTQQFVATGTYSDATTQTLTTTATWASATPATATISNAAGSKGLASAVAAGTSVITATVGAVVGSTTLTVTHGLLASIAVTPATPAIAMGTKQQFVATGTYDDTTTQDLTAAVTWASATMATATISNAAASIGEATGVAVGTSVISATLGTKSGSTTLTVTSAHLVSIAVTPTNPSIAKGTQEQFVATGFFDDATTQDVSDSATWASTKPLVATVSSAADSSGLASGLAVGTTTISATIGTISGSTTLAVTAATLVSIAVTPATPSIAKGTRQQFVATGTYTDATTQVLTATVTWASATPATATISTANDATRGRASAVAVGTTVISATSGTVHGMTTLTVTAATLVSIAVTPAAPSIAKGTSQQFVATGTYTDATAQIITDSVTWDSATAATATISNAAASTGLASGVAMGTSVITATMGAVHGMTTLTVTAATLMSIAVTPATPSIAKGATQQFVATGTYSDASTQILTNVATWVSATPATATIDSAGNVRGLATSLAAGTTVISATRTGVTGMATLTVTP